MVQLTSALPSSLSGSVRCLLGYDQYHWTQNEPVSSEMYMLACAPIEDSDQPAHPRSLIRVFDRSSMGSLGSIVSSGGKLRR